MYDNRGKSEIFLEILLKDSDEHIVAQNYFYPVPIKDIVGIRNPQLSVSIAVPYKVYYIFNIYIYFSTSPA